MDVGCGERGRLGKGKQISSNTKEFRLHFSKVGSSWVKARIKTRSHRGNSLGSIPICNDGLKVLHKPDHCQPRNGLVQHTYFLQRLLISAALNRQTQALKGGSSTGRTSTVHEKALSLLRHECSFPTLLTGRFTASCRQQKATFRPGP